MVPVGCSKGKIKSLNSPLFNSGDKVSALAMGVNTQPSQGSEAGFGRAVQP